MTWVVDASSAVGYLLGEGSEDERNGMLGDIHAPSLIDVEVTQTLRGLVRGSKLELVAAERARQELAQLAVRRHPDIALLRPRLGAAGCVHNLRRAVRGARRSA